MIRSLALILTLLSPSVAAETVVAARTIRSQAILTEGDLKLAPGATPGAIATISEALGKETRVVLYAGRPVMPNQIGRPALIERNAMISLVYVTPVMRISTEGRSLGRAGYGEPVRVLNISSRTTVTAIVSGPSEATVQAP